MEKSDVALEQQLLLISESIRVEYDCGAEGVNLPVLYDWYSKEVLRTAPKLNSAENFEANLNHAAMGLAGECGEVVDLIKKHQHHGVELNREKILQEAGDVFWYLQYLCLVLGVQLDDIAIQNVRKLRLRYQNGFNTKDSIERKDEAVHDTEQARPSGSQESSDPVAVSPEGNKT